MDRVKGWKTALAAGVAALTALWGWFGWLIIAWFACMALDVFTGMAAAAKKGEWSSKKAREGLWRKGGCVAAVAAAGILDLVVGLLLSGMPQGALPFDYTVFLCPLVVVWYLLTELGSIVENGGSMGAPVPIWLKRAVAALRDQVDGRVQVRK